MPIGLIGKKLGHTRVYDAQGVITPVTVILAGPNRVLQIRTPDKDKYSAVQLAFGEQKPQRLTKPELGHLVRWGALSPEEAKKAHEKAPKGQKRPLTAVAFIREFRDFSLDVKPGDLLGASLFAPGDYVDVTGITKGRGFEGVVKRHGFAGGDASHGAKGWHRRSGAIGCRLFPGHVNRGMRMPGHMGQVRRTVQNLQVVQVRPDDNLLLIKGSVPGAEGDYVLIRESKKLSRARVAELKRKAEERAKAAQAKGRGGAKTAVKK